MEDFEKLSKNIRKKQGLSKASSNAIESSIGRKKYNNVVFQRKAMDSKNK